MRGFFIGLAIAAAGFALGQIAIGVFGVTVAVALLFIGSAKTGRQALSEDSVRPEQRVLIRPLRKLRDEIAEIVERNKDSSAVKVIGAEAIGEADRILKHCIEMLALQASVKSGVTGRDFSEELAQVELELATPDDVLHKETLEATLQAKKLEAQSESQMRDALTQIDANLQRAHAALSEMKARLSVSATRSQESGMDDSLNDTISRMKSLSASFDEAEDLLRVHTQ